MSNNQNKAAIYVRDSTGKETSIQKQILDCQTLLEQQGYETSSIYIEKDISLKSLNTMLEHAKEQLFSKVFISSLDRLSRNSKELIRIINLLNDYNIKIQTCTENFNQNSIKIISISSALSEFEKQMITDRETQELTNLNQ